MNQAYLGAIGQGDDAVVVVDEAIDIAKNIAEVRQLKSKIYLNDDVTANMTKALQNLRHLSKVLDMFKRPVKILRQFCLK